MTDLDRRAFLATMARLALGVTIGSALPAHEPATPARGARACIILHMIGGMSHLDTLDPKTLDTVAGPLKPLATNVDGVFLGQFFPRLAERMDRCALIRSLTSNQGAHEQAQYLLRTGQLMRGNTVHPTLGAWDVHLRGRINPTLPPYVSISRPGNHSGAGFFEASCQPLPIGNPASGLAHAAPPSGISDASTARRRDLLARFDTETLLTRPTSAAKAYHHLFDEAVQLMQSQDLIAFDLKSESAAARTPYGDDSFGTGCLLARRLVQHGVRHVEVAMGGWDTHDDHFDRIESKCEILDRALPALLDDLKSHGLLDSTLVVLASEFGRTPTINGNGGRDHHPSAFSCLLAGGGVRGGHVHGATDERAHQVAHDPVQLMDLQATLAYGLGLPLDRVVTTPDGRPFTVGDKGTPLTHLFT